MMILSPLLRRGLLACLLMLTSIPASAAIQCMASSTNTGFGTYDRLDVAPNDSTGSITVTCFENALIGIGGGSVNYSIALSTGGSGTYTPRRMANGGNNLNYNLYTNSPRTSIWGNATGGTFTVPGNLVVPGCVVILFIRTCNSVQANHVVYSRMPASQNSAVGSYSDMITVTVTY